MDIQIVSRKDLDQTLQMKESFYIHSLLLQLKGFPTFSSDQMNQILEFIRRCTALEGLFFHIQSFEMISYSKTFGEIISRIPTLTSLTLTCNEQIGSNPICFAIAHGIGANKQLTRLRFQMQCKIQTDGIKDLMRQIKHSQRLLSLDLDFSENKMDEDICKLILQPILENQSIERVVLDLSVNKLQGGTLSKINQLPANHCIKTFQLSFNENDLGDEGSKKISEALSCCRVVSELSLNFEQNSVGNDGASAIAQWLSNLEYSLQDFKINLRDNQLKKEGLQKIGKSMAKLRRLTIFDINLSKNTGMDIGMSTILESLQGSELSKLDINLSESEMSTDHSKCLFEALQDYNKMDTLKINLESNYVDEISLDILTYSIQTMPKISEFHLYLDNNRIDTGVVKELGAMIKAQTEIRSVFITAGWKYNRLVIEYRQGDKSHPNKRNKEKQNEKDKEDE